MVWVRNKPNYTKEGSYIKKFVRAIIPIVHTQMKFHCSPSIYSKHLNFIIHLKKYRVNGTLLFKNRKHSNDK